MNVFNKTAFVKAGYSLEEDYIDEYECEYVINSSHDPINSSFSISNKGDSEEEMLRKMNELQEKIKKATCF